MPWFQADPARFRQEVALMAERSRAQLRRVGGALMWIEELRSLGREPYLLAIEYPERFPHEAPKAFIVTPDVSGAPHRLSDGSLCLWSDPIAAAGVKTTAVSVRSRAIAWFFVYENWRRTGAWSAPQH
jgi:hypothetical protein